MKCLIVYFSQSGTTAKVAGAIAVGLREEGYEIDLCNLKDSSPPPVAGYDLLGIGSPVYYYRQPFNVTDYVAALPELAGMPAFTFNTHGTYRFDAARELKKSLSGKGAKLVGHFASQGVGTFLPYARLGYVFSPEHPKIEELAAAEMFGREVAARAASKTSGSSEDEQNAPAIYRLERLLCNRWLARHFYSRCFGLNKDRCNKCGLCIMVCPISSLKRDDADYPTWQRDCILCFTCESRCPQDAIRSPLTWAIFRPFLVYNVRKASRDSSLGFVRVRHAKGRTERL